MAAKKEDSGSNKLVLLVILLVFLLIIDISTIAIWKFSPTSSSSSSTPKTETGTVTEIISGNIVRLSDARTVKLIGIDSPSAGQQYYNESVNFLKFTTLNNQVTLESDVIDKDSLGNLLRYVYVRYNDQQLFINLESVRQGFSLPFHIDSNQKYRTQIEAAHAECLTRKIGICG